MNKNIHNKLVEVHNKLFDKMGIEADKYAREDVMFTILCDVDHGRCAKAAFIDAFSYIYGIEISDRDIESIL